MSVQLGQSTVSQSTLGEFPEPRGHPGVKHNGARGSPRGGGSVLPRTVSIRD